MSRASSLSGLAALLACTVFLSACGGSSDSGGGAALSPGTYTGTFTLTATRGGQSASETGTTTVVINPDGSVVVDPGTPFEFSGMVNGNTFTASLPGFLLNEPGVTCTGPTTMTGSGNVQTVSGNFGGTTVCNGVTTMWSGSFSLTRVSSQSRAFTGIAEEMRDLLRSF